jgi:hypothetical protein
MYLVRVAHAHAVHAGDIASLRVILDKLATGKRLTRLEAARVRHAQDEARRRVDGFDRASSVRSVLTQRTQIRDRHASRALREVVAAGSAYAPAYGKRAMEPSSVQVLEAMRATYEDVRKGLSTAEQTRRIRALFDANGLALFPNHLKRLVRTARQIADAGGPSDCALKNVAFVFGKSETYLRQHQKRPQLPKNLAPVAFETFSNMITATVYVLELIGWAPAEVEEFRHLAQILFARSDRTPESSLMLLFSGPSREAAKRVKTPATT